MAPASTQLADRPGAGVRVGLVCPYDLGVPGGVQRQVFELATHLAAAGHAPLVVGPGAPTGDEGGFLWKSAGGSVVVRGNASRVPIALGPGAWRRTRHALAGVDVVHVHEPLMPLVSLSALSSRKPLVATFHAATPPWVARLYRTVSPFVAPGLRRAQISAVSEVAARAVPSDWGVPAIIPNGLDVSKFEGRAERIGTQVLFLGRDEPRKGLDIVLGAWPEVRAVIPGATLVVAGASRPPPDPSIRFEGRVSEAQKKELLRSSGVFVAPHRGGESFGIVLAEAMASGCAVVASGLPAFTAVAGDSAAFFEVGSISALASSLAEVLGDGEVRRELAARGEQSVRRFDWSTVLESYVGAYQAAIDAA